MQNNFHSRYSCIIEFWHENLRFLRITLMNASICIRNNFTLKLHVHFHFNMYIKRNNISYSPLTQILPN